MPSESDSFVPRPSVTDAGMVPVGGVDPTGSPAQAHAEQRTSRALRLVARREHELLALSELSQELTISLDLYGVADLVLFNLMGQLGTSRAALWLISEHGARVPVLLRSHGIDRRAASALGSACGPWLLDLLEQEQRIILTPELEGPDAIETASLIHQESVALFAPILSRGEMLGFLAAGPRVGFGTYGPVELQVLQTSLGMVGVALHNTKLYNRLLENNRQLRLANENLMELDRLKSEFLSNVNHELRTPLTVVMASLDCLLENHQTEPQVREFLKVALAESQTLKRMLEDLLDFSDASRNRIEFSIETSDVAVPLRAYFEERLPGVTQGLRELTFRATPGLPAARYDRSRLLRIVDALVDNAVKFTSQGARIEIRVSPVQENGASRVRVDVADDGPGIPPDEIAGLFDSFSQRDGSATRKVGGMGLGLAFAKEMAERMGGSLTVRSEIGSGSTFSVFLPVA